MLEQIFNFLANNWLALATLVVSMVSPFVACRLALKQSSRSAIFEEKRASLIESMYIIDIFVSNLEIKEGGVIVDQVKGRMSTDELTEKARRCHSSLVTVCNNNDIPNKFVQILCNKNGDIVERYGEYRILARKELGLRPINFDKNRIFLAKVPGNPKSAMT